MATATVMLGPDETYLYGDVNDIFAVPAGFLVEERARLEAVVGEESSPLEQAALGFVYYHHKDMAGAREWIEKCIVNGRAEVESKFPAVLAILGQLYDMGQGGPIDRSRAFEFYRAAANAGVPEAQFNLGRMYYSGVENVLESNDIEAVRWLERGLSESSRQSCFPLFDSYMNLQRKSFSIQHGRKNATHLQEMLTVSKIYLEGNIAQGLTPRPIRALMWLTNAATNGSFQACLWLGAFIIAGLGEFSDVRKGRIWIRKAACGGPEFTDALQIESCFMEGNLQRGTQAVIEVIRKEDIPLVPQIEERLISDCKAEISRLFQIVPPELSNVRMEIRVPIALSVDILKKFNYSPTARRMLHAFELAKEGERLLQMDTLNEIESKRLIQCFAEAYLLDTTVLHCLVIDESKVEAICQRTFSEDPTCEDALIARIPLHASSNHLEQNIALLTRALEVMENTDRTKTEKSLLKLSRVYFLMGCLQYWNECYDSSLKSFEKTLELSSDDITALEGTAECFRKLGRLSDSKKFHIQFLSVAPKCHKQYPGACYRMAEINLSTLDVAGFCSYFEKGLESEKYRLPFLPEVDLLVKQEMFGLYIATKTDGLPFCSSCLQLETDDYPLTRCGRCWSVYYCNSECQKRHWEEHNKLCRKAEKCSSKERENVYLAKERLAKLMSAVHSIREDSTGVQIDSFATSTQQLLDDVRGLKESIGSDPLEEFHIHTHNTRASCDSEDPTPVAEELEPGKYKHQGDSGFWPPGKTSQVVHETGKGAAGSRLAVFVDTENTPIEVQKEVIKTAGDVAKSIEAADSRSTKADVGASGRVALYFGKITDNREIDPCSSVQNYIPQRLKSFTGRTDVLEALHKLLAGRLSCTGGEEGASIVALCGLGGTGKSSTAAEYCWLQASYYTSGVYWLSADSVHETLCEVAVHTLGRLYEDIYPLSTKSIAYEVLADISRRPSPWLIVVDNVDVMEQLQNGALEYILFGNWKQSGACHGAILVTTRFRPDVAVEELHLLSADNAVELEVFHEDEATEFVLKSVPTVDSSRPVAARLSRLLGYLPLALEQATSGIRSMKCKIEDYLKDYKKLRTELMKRYKASKVDTDTSGQRMTILTTWQLNFREISRDSNYGEVAGMFLKLCAYFRADRIPVVLINNGLCPESSAAEDIESVLHVRMMVDLLTKLSLFREDLPGLLQVHRLVQEVQRDELKQHIDTLCDVFQAGVRSLHRALQQYPPPDAVNILSSKETGSYETWGSVAPHCLEFQEHLLREVRQIGSRYTLFLNAQFADIINTSAFYASAIGRQMQSKHIESIKFRLLNSLNDLQDNASLLPLTTVQIPLESKAQAAVLRAIRIHASKQNRESEHSRLESQMPTKDETLGDPEKEDPLSVAFHASRIHIMPSHEFAKAFETALRCISLKPHRHEGYSLLTELFYKLNCSTINFPRSAAAMAKFLCSPCCEEEWFKTAYPDLKYVEVSSLSDLQGVLDCQSFYANYVVILSGIAFVMDTFCVRENISFVALTNAHLSVFESFTVHKSTSFIGVEVIVNRNPVDIRPTASVDLILCKVTTKQTGYTGIYVAGSAYLDSCVVSDCGGGGLKVDGKHGSAVVMSCTFARNKAAALEACHQGQLLAMKNKIFENRQGCYLCPFPGQCLIKLNSIYLNRREGLCYLEVSRMDLTPPMPRTLLDMQKEKAVSRVRIDFDGNMVSENGSYGINVQAPISVGSLGIVRIRNNLITSNMFWGVFIDTPISKDNLLVLENNQIRRNSYGGIFVRKFDSARYSICQNVVEKQQTPFGSFVKVPYDELNKNNTVEPADLPRQLDEEPMSWIDPFCHRELKEFKDDKSAYFCKRCYSVRYCSEKCLDSHLKRHSKLCEIIRNKYSSVIHLAPSPPAPLLESLSSFMKLAEFPKTADPRQLAKYKGSRFLVTVRSNEHDPSPSQRLHITLTDNDGYLGSFECADLVPLIFECGSIVARKCSVKEISCWAVTEDAGKSLRLFYHELAPLKPNK
jgi:TPR repeat protein/tetratricopeptide (TPR) repeat protein